MLKNNNDQHVFILSNQHAQKEIPIKSIQILTKSTRNG